MYVLYQEAIIWVLPVYSTIEKKVEKKVSPPISPFLEHKRWKHFFSPFLVFFIVYESHLRLDAILSIQWTFPPSMMSRLPPSYPRVIRHFTTTIVTSVVFIT